jgi:hypothetical protein
MNVMRKSVTGDLNLDHSAALPATSKSFTRAARLAAVALGIGMIFANGVARAQDAASDDDDSTFEEKIIKNIMGGIGATNMDNRGIDYRERSPLVIPPKVDLPPPASASAEITAPNWPKDVDEQERARIRKLSRQKKVTGSEGARPLMPDELAAHKTAHVAATEPMKPGVSQNPMLSPSQLGFKGNLLGTMFGGTKSESAPFTGEPDRETLTQPPPGYQTPSPNFAYGTGPKQPLAQQGVYNIQTGKEEK